MSLKLWTTDINKLYIWSTEINKAYLGATLVYDKTTTPNWLLNNLVSYYKADVNGSFPDEQWNNPWTISWSSFVPSAKINWWYSTDGVNDYIDTSISNLNTIHTFWLWVKNSDTATKCLMWTFNSSSTWSYQVFFNADWLNTVRLQSEWASSTGIRVFSNVNTKITDWLYHYYLFEIDYTTGTGNIYIDNILQGKTVVLSNTRSTDLSLPLSLYLGCRHRSWVNDFCIQAEYDELGYWEEQLSTQKKTDLYNSWAWLSYDNFTT